MQSNFRLGGIRASAPLRMDFFNQFAQNFSVCGQASLLMGRLGGGWSQDLGAFIFSVDGVTTPFLNSRQRF